MLSYETEGRVARMLIALSEGERSVEISRQVLCDNYDFDSYQVFKEIDSEGKSKVDALNIIESLNQRGIYATDLDAEFIIQFYDEDGDHALSYSEFLNMVRSSNSFIKSQRSNEMRMPFNVKYSMGKLLEKEFNLSRDMAMYISDIKQRCDFNVHDIFHSMKTWNVITPESLKSFLDKHEIKYLDSNIKAIIKRLDINNDGQVDLVEFSLFFGCPICHCENCSCCCTCCHYQQHHHHHLHSVCCRSPSSLSIRSSSPLRDSRNIDKVNRETNNQKDVNANMSNGLKSTTYQSAFPEENERTMAYVNSPEIRRVSPNLSLRLSPERRFSPQKEKEMRISSPLRNSNSNNNISTIRSSNMPISNINYEERQFIDYLKAVMESETEIEQLKIDLALRCDFNVEDAFRIFELDGRGYLTEDDLKFGLSLLDVFATNKDVKVLMKRFDLNRKGVLNFGDFFDMVTPYEKNYRSMIENRPPNHCCCCRTLDAFNCTTRFGLQEVFRTLICTENKCNGMKIGFSSLRSNLKTIIASIDVLGYGYFTDANFERYLKRKNVFALQKESDLLFIHLDRNRDGKVEYFEVLDELTPVY